jgi:hypothetical protein
LGQDVDEATVFPLNETLSELDVLGAEHPGKEQAPGDGHRAASSGVSQLQLRILCLILRRVAE